MNVFGVTLSRTDLWLLGGVGLCLAWLVPQWLAVAKEKQTVSRAAAAKLRGAFSPALARLENARLHDSTHDVPDVDGLLQNQFEALAAAVEEFRPHVHFFYLRGYKKAWQQYCEIAHAGTVSPVFMASTINDRDPYAALEQLIRAVLRYAKT